MVHIGPPRASALVSERDDAWRLSGKSRLRHSSHMKNFVRLVQFAWRYRVRFGLSIGCAAMVALLFFTELGAVYPLLHILFDSQNPKRWVSEKITSIENEIVVLDARAFEARAALELAESGQRIHELLRTRYLALDNDYAEKEAKRQEHERRLGVTELRENIGQPLRNEPPELESVRHAARLADSRLKELRECSRVLDKSGTPGLSRRLRDIAQEKADRSKVLGWYRTAQPYIERLLAQ